MMEPLIITLPSSRYDLDNAEKDVKHLIVIIFFTLTLSTLGKIFSRQYIKVFPKETFCMKCLIRFSCKNQKKISSQCVVSLCLISSESGEGLQFCNVIVFFSFVCFRTFQLDVVHTRLCQH